VKFLTEEAGISQFIDIGTGLPAQGNVHEVAQRANPGARVVYVDYDPVVVAHGRAILVDNANCWSRSSTFSMTGIRPPRSWKISSA
jgi:hypothetical protein